MVGVLGCMAERLKDRLLEREKLVDIVAGPDAYRDLPRLLAIVQARHASLAAWTMISHHSACLHLVAPVAGINSLACHLDALRTMRALEIACCWPVLQKDRARKGVGNHSPMSAIGLLGSAAHLVA